MPHTGKPNPRYANGSRRRAIRDRWRSLGAPCAICGGDIDYSLPAGHPMSFEVDEIVPVSRWKEGGYASAEACALDFRNTQPTHRLPSLQPAQGQPPRGAASAVALRAADLARVVGGSPSPPAGGAP